MKNLFEIPTTGGKITITIPAGAKRIDILKAIKLLKVVWINQDMNFRQLFLNTK